MSGSLEPIFVDVQGAKYQLFKGADNKFYLHDPHHKLDPAALETGHHSHVALPGAEETAHGGNLSGLGQSAAQYGAAAATALSFVPVVGPILGPIAGAVSSLFGGGDPTPADSIWANIINTREAVANLTNQLAGKEVDTFKVPAGLNRSSDGPNGGNTGNVWASAICNEILNGQPFNIQTTDIHRVKRAQWYQCLQILQQKLQALQQQLHDQQLTQSIVQSLTPAQNAAPAATVPTTTTVAPTTPAPPVTPVMVPQPVYQPTPQVIYQPPAQTSSMGQMLPYIMLGGMVIAGVLLSKR